MSELDTGPCERVCALGVSGLVAEMAWTWLPSIIAIRSAPYLASESGRLTSLVAMRALRWCAMGDGRLSWRAMEENRMLAAVSVAQLASGLGGMALAIRRRHAFDVPFWRGQPSAVGRDCVLMGTALSAPVVMLAAQTAAIAALLRHPDASAERALGGLGAAMTAGYLAERLVRQRLIPAGWDKAETPVVVAGISLAAAMAVLGLRPTVTRKRPAEGAQSRLIGSDCAIRGM